MSREIPADYETFEPLWSDIPLLDTVSYILHAVTAFAVVGVAVILGANDLVLLLAVPGTLVLTTVLHECIHASVGRLIGCQVSMHLNRDGWYLYVINGGKYKTRREKLAIALAPLVVLDCAALSCIVIWGVFTLPGLLAVVAFAVNTLGAVGDAAGSDIETAIQAWHLPSGTRVREAPNEPSKFIRPQTSRDE